MVKIFLSLLALLLMLISCNDNRKDDPGIGPCYHEYKEPILNIVALRDSATDVRIDFAVIKNLKVNNYYIANGTILSGLSYGIIYKDSVFMCNFPCGFGYQEGTYEFTIGADGYKDKKVKIDSINYSIFHGGCPSFNDGGKRIDIYLSKE